MDDVEFVKKYARIISTSPLSSLPVLCEGFVRAFQLKQSAEEVAMQLVKATREAENPQASLDSIIDQLWLIRQSQ